MTDLQEQFRSLPQEVRDWVYSPQVLDFVIELNDRLGVIIAHQSVIIKTIKRLLVKDLQPNEVIAELADGLELTKHRAYVIAAEIQWKVFDPIKQQLQKLGIVIDIGKLGVNVDSETGKFDERVEKNAVASLIKPAMPAPKIVLTPPPAAAAPVMPKKIDVDMGGTRVRIIEKNAAPATAHDSPMAPRVIETPIASQSNIPIRVFEKTTATGSAPAQPKTVEITGGARLPKSTVSIPPQQIKVDPQYLPTLKAEGDKIMLKEEAPVIIHKEGQIQPIIEPTSTFRSNVEANYIKPAPPKTIAARIELGTAAESPKAPAPVKVVNFSQNTPSTPASNGAARPIGGISAAPTPPSMPAPRPAVPSVPPAPQRTVIKIEPTSPKPPAPFVTAKSEAKLSGNTVDLS